MRPASYVYSSPWTSGHLSTPPPPPALAIGRPPTVPPRYRPKRYYTLTEWSLIRQGLTGAEAEEWAAGMGALGQTGSTIALSTPQIVGGVLTTGIATSTASAGAAAGTGTFLGLTAAAIPIIGAVVAGVTLGLMALFGRKGPRQKVATTQIVDKVEPLLQQNLSGYMAGPHTASSQQQALNNFDAGWQYVMDNCGIPEMGDPGQRCVSERQAGGVWDWFARYRTPIAQDPNVKPDPLLDAATGGLVDALTGGSFGGAGSGTLLLGLGLLAVAFFAFGGVK